MDQQARITLFAAHALAGIASAKVHPADMSRANPDVIAAAALALAEALDDRMTRSGFSPEPPDNAVVAAVAAVAAERERCAKVAESYRANSRSITSMIASDIRNGVETRAD